MELSLHRTRLTAESTIGELSIDGVFECYTLEDRVRPDGVKVQDKTAIPEGRYEVAVTFSQRFQRLLPLLLDVPGFSCIRIHPGNTAADTSGCILVGTTRSTSFIGNSRIAFAKLFSKIRTVIDTEKVFITIRTIGLTGSSVSV